MHSFWAREAERSFLQAAELDPAAPMPWWGVAMVAAGDYRPGFQLEFVNGVPLDPGKDVAKPTSELHGAALRAREAAQRALELSKTPGKASPLEQLYIRSVAARRGADSPQPAADYVHALRVLVAQYPAEVEAKTYLALILMSGFTTPDKRPREGSMEAVEILRGLLKTAPDHPGVQHYVIHGWEGSTFAAEAWPSCEKYPKLAPQIPHALHMPGHIYAQTGRWQDAEAAFHAAASLERSYMDMDALYGTGHFGHNMHFEIVALAFQGKYDEAIGLAHELMGIPETPRQKSEVDDWYIADRQGWYGLMRSLVYGERWADILDSSKLPPMTTPREAAWYHWARTIAYAEQGNATVAEEEIRQMDRRLKEWTVATKTKQLPPVLALARLELDGHVFAALHRGPEALKVYERASADERALRYTEPPAYPRPIAEVAGQLALALGDRARAAKFFQTALEQYPQSQKAQQGLRAAGGQAAAQTAQR
jgi:tetratricopeptide (TPR) repeat protein